MFCIDTRGLPHFRSYEDAYNYWASRKPWRGDSNTNDRPLDSSRKKKHMGIRLGDEHQVICRLYNTDILTMYKDGRVKVKFYASASTQRFINTLWSGAYVDMSSHVVWDQYRYWNGARGQLVRDDYAMFDPEGKLVNGRPYHEPKLNVKRANAARKASGFNQYKIWRDAAVALSNVIQPVTRWERNKFGSNDCMELLTRGAEGWKQLATYMEDKVLLAYIYAQSNVVDVVEYDAFSSPAAFRSWKALCNKYHWVRGY